MCVKFETSPPAIRLRLSPLYRPVKDYLDCGRCVETADGSRAATHKGRITSLCNHYMGIDIYVRWKGQTKSERERLMALWLTTGAGKAGYLREAYHGEPYATRFLCPEAFEEGGARIEAATLQERLPHTLALVEERSRKLYDDSESEIEETKQSFRDFVALCEEKEKETGEPVTIMAWY